MKTPLLSVALCAAAMALGLRPAAAQCFTPDGLDAGPCCTPVAPSIPALVPFALESSGVCWDACGSVTETCTQLVVGAATPAPQCGTLRAPLEVLDCGSAALMKGDLVLDYTRTWEERLQPGGPAQYQVWRFAAKVDLTGDVTLTPGCPVPPSLVPTAGGPPPTAFFYGYYDLARNCQTGALEHALVLFHGCDRFQHAPGIASNPGVFNPTTTYALVGPDTPLNPFVPVAFPTPGGPLGAEALRSTESGPAGVLCRAEEAVTQGVLLPLGSGCLCPLSLGSPQQTASFLEVSAVCGSGAQSLNFFPTAPWLEFVTTSLGQWTTGAAYPGPERVAVGEGLFLYRDVCASTGVVEQSVDVFYGGLTFGGFFVPPLSPVGPPPQGFVDLASNFSELLPGPVTPPLVGEVRPTEHLIYVNL